MNADALNRHGFRPQTTIYHWDEEDRLSRVSLPNGEIWHYQYDVLGRRCRKYLQQQTAQQTGYPSQRQHDIHYLWQGDQLSQQQAYYANGNVAITQWLYEPGTFKPLAQIRQLDTPTLRGKPELHYAVTDFAGNVRELCDPQGQIHWRGKQELWQNFRQWRLEGQAKQYLEEAVNEPLHCDLRHQGQIYDRETGLYYNRHRYYDPQICQYLSPDPIGLAGGTRPQAYVHNPLEWVEPLGLAGCPINSNREQRQARISELAEANAQRRLQEMQNMNSKSHFLERHGAQTSLKSQLKRSIDGTNPTTGVKERIPTAATRFNSHRDQLNAIQRAQTVYRQTNGEQTELIVPFGRNIGEGYSKIGQTYRTSNTAQVFLDENGHPITAFPIWGQ